MNANLLKRYVPWPDSFRMNEMEEMGDIPKMIELWKMGYDVVYGRRKKREGETFFKKVSAKLYYRILSSYSAAFPL